MKMSQIPSTTGEKAGGSQEPAWTVLSLLEWTTKFLREHGSSSPRLDAEVLLAHARGCQRIELYMAFDQPASSELRDTFRELIRQRAKGAPVAYLVGMREFFSRAFKVTADVLIPRPETEFVVIALLELVAKRGGKEEALQIADIGTGSGILAVTAALELPNCRLIAVDKSRAALDIARRNATDHGVEDRIEFVEQDVRAGFPDGAPLDFIISNPPYIKSGEFESLPKDVRDFEPKEALIAGDDGLEVIRPLVGSSAEKLKSGGYLLMEISPLIEQPVLGLLAEAACFEGVQVRRDLSQLPRVVIGRRK
jgi:release factor glutamine methyltransferase